MTDASDEVLMAQYRGTGDLRHFEELVQRHLSGVRAMIYPMVLNAADDVTQEVFLRVARHLTRFRGRARFSTWLFRVAHNTALDFLRRNGHRPQTLADSAPLAERADPASGPDAQTAAREEHAHITRALARLPPTSRAAITLTVMEGRPLREAARIAQCLPATLYWRVHEARRRLRRELEVTPS